MGLDQRRPAIARDGELRRIDPGLDAAIDGFQEVVAMVLRVKREEIVAEQSVENLLLPRTDAERFTIRPGDMPEMNDHEIRASLTKHSGQQGKVIVLHEHDSRFAHYLLEHRLSELVVDYPILLPVVEVEFGPRVSDVAERPKRLVRKAVVITLFFVFAQPDAPQSVSGLIRRNPCSRALIARGAVGVTAAMAHPDAAACTHDRVQGAREAARWSGPTNVVAVERM